MDADAAQTGPVSPSSFWRRQGIQGEHKGMDTGFRRYDGCKLRVAKLEIRNVIDHRSIG
jgi:hypothetical protein